MINMEEKYWYIPSESVRKYLIEIRHEFTDFEVAALISINQISLELPETEYIEALRKISESTDDGNLRLQIFNEIEVVKKCTNMFFTDRTENDIFLLEFYDQDNGYETSGYFKSIEVTRKFAKNKGIKYKISKIRLFDENSEFEEDELYHDNIIGYIVCNENDEIIYSGCNKFLKNYDQDCFTDKFIFVPHPFRTGDIIRYRKSNEPVGIIPEFDEYDDMREFLMFRSDSDNTGMVTPILFVDSDGKTLHDCMDYMNLEKVELKDITDSKYKTLLYELSETVKRKYNFNSLFAAMVDLKKK